MTSTSDLGRALVIVGAVTLVLGILLSVGGRLPWLGRLPGDIVVRRPGLTLYLPLGTCLVLSVVLTVVLSLWRR
jgi:hypothetical protein